MRSDEDASKEKDCKSVGYTDTAKQKENGFVNCPDNSLYFLIVAAAFVGGLVISYIILQLIIKCSQFGAPKKGDKKGDKKKDTEKKAQEQKKQETKGGEKGEAATGSNGGILKV